jgi:hypothetical protein
VTSKALFIPAITKEVEFCAHNVTAMEAVLHNDRASPLRHLTHAVADRGNADAQKLLRALEAGISGTLVGIMRLNWVNTNRGENWASWGKLYMPRGPMRRVGSAGILLGEAPTPLRLLGWIWPRWGGLDGRRELVHLCQKKVKAVCLPHENAGRYPYWKDDDGVIWLDYQLTLRSSLADVVKGVSLEARRFFRVAKPILKKLAE